MRDFEECRTCVDHLRRVHGRLADAVHAVSAALDCECGIPLSRLRRFQNELTAHFATEDDGGCLEEAVCFDPKLAADLRILESERPELLDRVDGMLEHCAKGDYGAGGCQLRREFESLVDDLEEHERRECHILEQAFGTGHFDLTVDEAFDEAIDEV